MPGQCNNDVKLFIDENKIASPSMWQCPGKIGKNAMETNVPVTRVLDILPQKIDGYRVLEKLGKGGMGIVYKVEKGTGEIYALKILLDKDASEQVYFQRFTKEIQILQQFNHPNIVKIHAMGIWQGKPYFIMDYLEGLTLGKHLKNKQRLLAKEALNIFYPIACALVEVHKSGIVHRDIKPENIMICNKKPYLMDFGVAVEYSRQTRMTATGVAIGTLNYMPPEQVQGQRKKIGPWSDVYSLGATLYHTLTGIVPFFGHTEFETMLRLSQEEIPSIRKYNPRFSKDLEWLVLKATQKNHEDRYSSMQEFAQDIDSILKQKKIPRNRKILELGRLVPYFFLVFISILTLSIAVLYFSQEKKQPIQEQKTVEKNTSKIVSEIPKVPEEKYSEKKETPEDTAKNLKDLEGRLKSAIEKKESRETITPLTHQIANIYKNQGHIRKEMDVLENCPYPDREIMERKCHLDLQMNRNSNARYDLFLLKEIFALPENRFLPLWQRFQDNLKKEESANSKLSAPRQKIRKILRDLAFVNAAKWTLKMPLVQESWQNAYQLAKSNFDDFMPFNFMPFMVCVDALLSIKEKDLEKAKKIMEIRISGVSLYEGFAWMNSKNHLVFDFWPETTFVNAILHYYLEEDEKARYLLEKFQTDKEYYDYPTERRLYAMAEPYLKSLQNKNEPRIALSPEIANSLLRQLLYRLGDRIIKTSVDMVRTNSVDTAITICEDFLSLEYWEYMFHYKMGNYCSMKRNWVLAERNFLIAKQYMPDFTELVFLLGELYFYTNRLEKAEECLEYCIQNPPQWDKGALEKAKRYLWEIKRKKKK
ncbi:MAG: serine/threonine protein kinase [Candidatus Brocadiae bacterium]|nr:serine/threonine protein kinase [Candidatus Brocadiia bacterium]